MKHILQLLLFLLLAVSASAQSYGNEWINYSQRYFAFKVAKTGLYRIDQATLTANGIPTGAFSSANMQLFGKQQEVPLHVVDGGDNSFDAGDYFLFYAEKNDGWLDSLVYKTPTDIGNPGYSLYNDTIQYFFTWNNQSNNLRFVAETDMNFNAYTPAPFVLKDVWSSASDYYSVGKRVGDALGSIYTPGESWAYAEMESYTGSSTNIPMATPALYTGPNAPAARIHVISTATNNSETTGDNNHHLRIGVGASNVELFNLAFLGYRMNKFDQTFASSVLADGTSYLRFDLIADQGATLDRQTLNYWRLRYPRLTNSNNSSFDDFYVPNNPAEAKTRIDLNGFVSTAPIVFCLGATPRILPTSNTSGPWQFLVPNNGSGASNRIIVGDSATAVVVSRLVAVNGTGQFTDFSALSTEEAMLMVYHPTLSAATANYANYRASFDGGSHNVVLANINELYQQFGGGVEKHILGLRRFAAYAYDQATNVKPKALFLVGKGIAEVGGARKTPETYAASLIPSFGYPSSDVAITAGLNGTYWQPLIPTGRISSRTNAELQAYLDKVILYESKQQPNSVYSSATKDWQKQVLHFVGGSDISQQTAFQGYMNAMKAIIEDSGYYAGNVTSYYKTSSEPLDPAVISGVTERISNGVSLMNFFSHAASSNNGFEINIDDPENWNNYGKYPVILGNSCYNGNLFGPTNSTSENFVNLAGGGAIAFISTISVGYAEYLNHYSNNLYTQFSTEAYGMSLSEQMQRTVQETQIIAPDSSSNLILEATCMQMTLHGDPMLKLNWHQKPEIEITPQSIFFQPENLNLSVDSIDLKLIMTNLGRTVTDSFYVEIIRDFPGTNIDSTYHLMVPHLYYKDTLSFRFPMQPNIGVGENKFDVSVDIPSFIPEQYDELTNNQLKHNLFVKVDGILPVYPYDFAVVPRDSVTVKASTINPIANVRTYFFELDTIHTYDSPQLRRFSITDIGGVKEVTPDIWKDANGNPFPLVCTDSTVYFWRVAMDSSVLTWTEFSFQYIPGKEGWGQDHFYQFKKNDFYGIVYDSLNRRRTFLPPEAHSIFVRAFNSPTTDNAWGIDNANLDYAAIFGGHPSIYVGVLDPVTLQPWLTRYGTQNPTHGFGNGNDNPNMNCPDCRGRAEKFFAFKQNIASQLAGFQDMIENHIPAGHYVVIYTTPVTQYSNWTSLHPSLYTMFQNLGSTLVHDGQPEKPFALFYRAGDPGSLLEKHWPDTLLVPHTANNAQVYLETTIYQSDFQGLEKTPMIGPAQNWGTVYWRRDSLEAFASDSVRLRIEAYDINLAQQLTIDTLFTPDDSLIQLNNILAAANYPYVRLGVYYFDDQFFTPAQVDRLHLLYQPVPEAAIDGTSAYYIHPSGDSLQQLQEGQQVSFAIDVQNISDYPMDSLLVRYWVEDANRVKHYIDYPRQAPLLSGTTLRDTIQFSTLHYGGLNSLWMEVNPYVNGSTVVTDQLEQFHFNNLLQIPFTVAADDIHPILDVTFNGQHILNGDIVSPESEIIITLRDENPYLIMNSIADTALFGIYLTDPSGVQRRIPFIDLYGNTTMQWIPADAQNKKFKIVYPSAFEKDGIYRLLVQGTDRSGNVSGDLEYRISFEVIHESSITYMMNYPNPFSTSTRFVFTLTGTEAPDDMIIQIMTVTGRVVREITEAEIGPINIGRNISAYAWDGTDEFGDPLANGVYLYRVKAKLNGEDIKHRESGADSHFKKEFGKMYLMR